LGRAVLLVLDHSTPVNRARVTSGAPTWPKVEISLYYEDIIFRGIREIKIEFIHLLYTRGYESLFFHITSVLFVHVTILIVVRP